MNDNKLVRTLLVVIISIPIVNSYKYEKIKITGVGGPRSDCTELEWKPTDYESVREVTFDYSKYIECTSQMDNCEEGPSMVTYLSGQIVTSGNGKEGYYPKDITGISYESRVTMDQGATRKHVRLKATVKDTYGQMFWKSKGKIYVTTILETHATGYTPCGSYSRNPRWFEDMEVPCYQGNQPQGIIDITWFIDFINLYGNSNATTEINKWIKNGIRTDLCYT